MDTSYIPTWLIKPIVRLDDRRPVDAIRDGDYREVSRLVAALEDMPVASVSSLDVDDDVVHGTFVRHIPGNADPLHLPSDPADGRWQHGSVIGAWYFADEPATAWAEWWRAQADTGLPPAHALPRVLWRWQVDLDRVALLDSDERLRRVGRPPPHPTARPVASLPSCRRSVVPRLPGATGRFRGAPAAPQPRRLSQLSPGLRLHTRAATHSDHRCPSRTRRYAHLTHPNPRCIGSVRGYLAAMTA